MQASTHAGSHPIMCNDSRHRYTRAGRPGIQGEIQVEEQACREARAGREGGR
jgi:hypothetical protein